LLIRGLVNRVHLSFDYLQTNAGQVITFQELLDFTEWTEGNLKTNISKRIREF